MKCLDIKDDYLFFISHSSEDTALAIELHDMLVEFNPAWEDKIFLDRSKKKPLETAKEWQNDMMKAVENSRHLIFITSKMNHVREGHGWLHEEVVQFQNLLVNRLDEGRPDKNVSYFGIFLCKCNLEKDLFSDKNHGSMYRNLYQRRQHLIFDEEPSLRAHRDSIRGKVLALVEGRDDDDFAYAMLGKSKNFLKNQIESGAMLDEKTGREADESQNRRFIEDTLLPPLKLLPEEGEGDDQSEFRNKTLLPLDAFFALIQQRHVQLIGTEGGAGKTTLMTKLYHRQLQLCEQDPVNHMIPLFVDAKQLSGNDNLILRHLAKKLLNDHNKLNSDTTSRQVNLLANSFALQREKPRYLLLIDGYNELSKDSSALLNEELRDFLSDGEYAHVRVVISGRTVDIDLPDGEYRLVELQELKEATVYGYLGTTVSKSVLHILRNPMYLKLYADTDSHAHIQTRTDLLREFLLRQERKDGISAVDKTDKAQYHIHLRHVLPAVAYSMVSSNASFLLSKKELKPLFRQILARITDEDYKEYYDEEYADRLDDSGFPKKDSMDLRRSFKNYCLRVCKLLQEDSNGNLEFVHQIYRDFFCAWYISEDIRFTLEQEERSSALSSNLFDQDVLEFAADLLNESVPCYDRKRERWDYSCNKSSCLVRQLNLLRQEDPDDRITIANILKMLRHARQKDLSGLDLSKLDLTASDLLECVFSRFDKKDSYPTSFSGARIVQQNLFPEDHHNVFVTACSNEKYVACLDADGCIKLWEKTYRPRFPEKVLTDLHLEVRRLLLTSDSSMLYAMTTHRILQIPLSDSFISKAVPETVFRSPDRLQDIRLNDRDEVYFSTVANPFNFKPLSDPDAPDRVDAYGFYSAAAAVDDRRIAFGDLDIEQLKFFCRAEDGTWQEQKYGYGQILEAYLLELEQLLRSFGLYTCFQTDDEAHDVRRSFFIRLQKQYMDRTHHHELIFNILAQKCKEVLENRISSAQLAQMDELTEKHMMQARATIFQNLSLFRLNGRIITGLSLHSDNKTLLVSGFINFSNKRRPDDKTFNPSIPFDNMAAVIDLETLNARVINYHRGDSPCCAFYCGDDIVLVTHKQVNVYNSKFEKVALIKPQLHYLRGLYAPEGKDRFYVFSALNIYEMDQNLHCVRSIPNTFHSTYLAYFQDETEGEYLCAVRRKTGRPPILPGPVIDLHSGASFEYSGSYSNPEYPKAVVSIGSVHFKIEENLLVAFCDSTRKDEVNLLHGLQVSGCDFRNIQGSAADSGYLEVLHRMGGMTDPLTLSEVQTVQETGGGFVPSSASLVLPSGLPDSPFGTHSDLLLASDSVKTSASKIWDHLFSDAFTGTRLDAADYAILDWVNRLHYATPEMINDLVDAGLIKRSRHNPDAGSRLTGELLTDYHFVRLNYLLAGDTQIGSPIATVRFPIGTKVLTRTTLVPARDPIKSLLRRASAKTAPAGLPADLRFASSDPKLLHQIRADLALGSWFCCTAKRHKDQLEDHALYAVSKTPYHKEGGANINGYLCLNGHPFFAQAVRGFNREKPDPEFTSKIIRLCILASYYRTVISGDIQLSGLKHQPVIVLICENYTQCKQLNSFVRHIYPEVRKLFTYDSLLTSEEAAVGAGCYLEFTGSIAHSLKLEDVYANESPIPSIT